LHNPNGLRIVRCEISVFFVPINHLLLELHQSLPTGNEQEDGPIILEEDALRQIILEEDVHQKELQQTIVMLKTFILPINGRTPFNDKFRRQSLLNVLGNALVLGRHRDLLRKISFYN
jgi:hypothetical protein